MYLSKNLVTTETVKGLQLRRRRKDELLLQRTDKGERCLHQSQSSAASREMMEITILKQEVQRNGKYRGASGKRLLRFLPCPANVSIDANSSLI